MADEEVQEGAGASGSASLAAKLNHLFATIHPKSRGPFSNQEAVRSIEEAGGPSISGTYLWMLRNGQRDNPSMQVIGGIARFFGVPVAYFFDSDVADRVDAQLEYLSAAADVRLRDAMGRAADVSPSGLRALSAFIEHLRDIEGLSDEDTDGDTPPYA